MAGVSTAVHFQTAANSSQRIIALGVVLAICYYAQAVVITFSCSLLGAVLLEPAVGLLTRIRLPRPFAALLVCLFALAGLSLVGGLLYSRSVTFVEELPQYETTIREAVGKVWQRVQDLEGIVMRLTPQPQVAAAVTAKSPRSRSRQPQPPPVQEIRVREDSNFLSKWIFPQLKSFYQFVLFASFIPFLVYFMLSWKEHMRRGFVNLFHDDNRMVAQKTIENIGSIVRGFLVGNFLIAVLLATLSALIFWFLHVPFPFLIGIVSGLLSGIPYLGLPLAMIPPVFSALGAYHSLSSYLIIVSIVAGLHLLALNLLYPKLVGSRVHLNPLAVTVAIMVGGWMWGAIGLLLAIPITAGLKAICDNVASLGNYGRMLGEEPAPPLP